MFRAKRLSRIISGIFICLTFSLTLSFGGAAPARAGTSIQNLKNIDAYEYTVLLQNFTEEELMVLDSMVTEQEIDQLVTIVEDPYALLHEGSSRPIYSLASEWRPNGCTASPDWIGRAHFTPSCNKHDACYASFSRTNRYDCDRAFRINLQAECRRVYSGNELMACIGVANTYYKAVRAVGWAFYKGQGANN